MSFSKEDYETFCENINVVNTVYDDVISSKKRLYGWASREIKAIFKKHMGSLPINTHFANDGTRIEVTYNLNDFEGKKLPLSCDLMEDLHMPVQISIQEASRLCFVLLPHINGGE